MVNYAGQAYRPTSRRGTNARRIAIVNALPEDVQGLATIVATSEGDVEVIEPGHVQMTVCSADSSSGIVLPGDAQALAFSVANKLIVVPVAAIVVAGTKGNKRVGAAYTWSSLVTRSECRQPIQTLSLIRLDKSWLPREQSL
jgi:hypothetical protein